MRQRIGEKKIRKYREETGLDVIAGAVRGNTHHRVDLYLRDGAIVYRWPDGTFEQAVNVTHNVRFESGEERA